MHRSAVHLKEMLGQCHSQILLQPCIPELFLEAGSQSQGEEGEQTDGSAHMTAGLPGPTGGTCRRYSLAVPFIGLGSVFLFQL